MLKNTYILYHEEPNSKKYLQDCIDSCLPFTEINPIPVTGPARATFDELQKEFDIKIAPFYTDEKSHNGVVPVFSCNAGHYRIWKMIVESGEPSVVLEHDAIVKQSFTSLKPVDGEILWLGPRILNMDDYTYPEGWETKYLEVDHWEGTHAYAITPKTAQMFLDYLDRHGINDSIDGQMGMRNMFDVPMTAVDPPSVVAVISNNRQSTIEATGNAAKWNAYNTDGFLAGLKSGVEPLILRQFLFSNKSFNQHTDELKKIITEHGLVDASPRAVLLIGGYEGLSTNWFSNLLLEHPDSQIHIVSQFRNTSEQRDGKWPKNDLEQIFKYNTYFSWYYYKLNIVSVDKDSLLLAASTLDPDIKFDLIYVDGNHEFKDVLYDAIVSWNLLKPNGLLIFDDMEDYSVSKSVDIFARTVYKKPIHNGNFSVFVKD